jgi:Holliday junction resolvasome RuvABC DNA-binding subunit
MRNKIEGLSLEFAPTKGSIPQNGLFDDALSALVNLGYKKNQAEQALKKVCEEETESSIEGLIKKSLNMLS